MIRIEHGGLAEKHVQELARILYYGFEEKIGALGLGQSDAEALIAAAVQRERALYVFDGDTLIGVAGLSTRKELFYHFSFALLRRYMSVLRAAWFNLILNMDEPLGAEELHLTSLAIAPDRRGERIGSQLLDALEDYGREACFKYLSLGVVDTNPAAKKLYERKGYQVVRTWRFGRFTQVAGFSGSDTMHKRLDE